MHDDRRRQLLLCAALAAPLFVRHARAADVPRFALGIASGQPHAAGVVLWTRLTGDDLPAGGVDVRWEVAHDEAFTRLAASGTETATAADAHSVHAEAAGLEPARWYWYRFSALGQQSAVGRTRTAPATDAAVAQLDFAIASCQRWDVGHYAAWRHAASEPLDLIVFLGDYIYESASGRDALRRHVGGHARTLAHYRARHFQYKSDPALQAAHAACPWLLVWDDHEVDNDYAGLQGQSLQPDFPAQRGAAYQAYWEHMPLPKSARPTDLAAGGAMRMHGRLDWGRLARIHLLDDRQMRDVQVCPQPGRGGSTTVRLKDCPALLDPKRSLLGAAQERWLADGWDLSRPWNLLAQQTLMARFSWEDPHARRGGVSAADISPGSGAAGFTSTAASMGVGDPGRAAGLDAPGGLYWTDGWDGYPAARNRLLGAVAAKRVPGVVVLGGDVHSHYVADLLADFDDPRSPVVASEFCGTSVTSLSMPQRQLDAARAFNPHVKLARSDRRGYVRFTLTDKLLQARLRALDDARDANSAIGTLATFTVDPARPGPVAG